MSDCKKRTTPNRGVMVTQTALSDIWIIVQMAYKAIVGTVLKLEKETREGDAGTGRNSGESRDAANERCSEHHRSGEMQGDAKHHNSDKANQSEQGPCSNQEKPREREFQDRDARAGG